MQVPDYITELIVRYRYSNGETRYTRPPSREGVWAPNRNDTPIVIRERDGNLYIENRSSDDITCIWVMLPRLITRVYQFPKEVDATAFRSFAFAGARLAYSERVSREPSQESVDVEIYADSGEVGFFDEQAHRCGGVIKSRYIN